MGSFVTHCAFAIGPCAIGSSRHAPPPLGMPAEHARIEHTLIRRPQTLGLPTFTALLPVGGAYGAAAASTPVCRAAK